MVTRWILRCLDCGRVWELPVSFNLFEIKRLYHYCRFCGRNTFHEVVGRVDDRPSLLRPG